MFKKAEPIFLTGLSHRRDVQAGFVLTFTADPNAVRVIFRCAAATFYRAYLNGSFVAHGPARAAHGCARVDEIDLTGRLCDSENHLAIEVAGYNRDCIYVTGDASFLQAEIVADQTVIAATNTDCRAVQLTQRLPAERFSHARCMGEVYALDAAFTQWRIGAFGALPPHPVERVDGPKRLLERGVPLSDDTLHTPMRLMGFHSHVPDPHAVIRPIAPLEHGEYLQEIAALSERPATECAKERAIPLRGRAEVRPAGGVQLFDLSGPSGVDFDFGEMKAGFLFIELETTSTATVDLVFVDHLEPNGTIDARAGDMNGVIRLHVQAGCTRFQAFEPHCLRYLRVIARQTDGITLHQVGVIDYAYPDRPTGSFACSDGDLNRIFEAARLTLRLNTQDVFMDCPGRERAGWLCDSFFSGRAMQMLFDDLSVERAMLENFLHAPQSEESPGFFPECYPGRAIKGGNFIPNWSMFLGLELREYVTRSGDTQFAEAYRPRIEALLTGLAAAQNRDGLLENLPGFVFIDWSAANNNEFKRPISTATNALYAMLLDSLAVLYQQPAWAAQAANICATLRRFLPTAGAMPDALRYEDGRLVGGDKSSEAAQYYLFWTSVADADLTQAKFFEQLTREYGPARELATQEPVLAPSNVFIGLYLRLETLARRGEVDRLLREMRALFLPMLARGPGTLWEHLRLEGSVCHGFASHAAVWLLRDVLGIGLPNAGAKKITIAPNIAGLNWARGTVLIDGRPCTVDWRSNTGSFTLTATIPPGYSATLRLPRDMAAVKSVKIDGREVALDATSDYAFTGSISCEIVSTAERV